MDTKLEKFDKLKDLNGTHEALKEKADRVRADRIAAENSAKEITTDETVQEI